MSLDLLDPGTGGSDLGEAIRRRRKQDPFAFLAPIGDAASAVGGAVGGVIEKARAVPGVGGALDALSAVGDATYKTPIGLAGLAADTVLGTGLSAAARRANVGRPIWELPKTAANLTGEAFGRIAQDEGQTPLARAIAGLTRGAEQVGGFVAPIPGAAGAARLAGRGANALPSALERSVGKPAPGAGAFGSRQPSPVTHGRSAPKQEPDPIASAKKQIAESQARQRATPTPPEDLATRYPTSVRDLENMRRRGDPIAGETPKHVTTDDTLMADLEASLRARGVEPPPTYTKRAPSLKSNMDELRQNALRQRVSGPTPTAAAAPDTALGQRMLGNESGIVAAAARGDSWVTPELLNKHYANESLVGAAKSGDVAAAREALRTLESLGASASNTAKHLRDSGVPLPRGATFAQIREALMPKPIKDSPPVAPKAPKPTPLAAAISRRAETKPGAAANEALATARGEAFAPNTGAALRPGSTAAEVRPDNVIPLDWARQKQLNRETIARLQRIGASRSEPPSAPPPPPPAPPPAPPTGATPPPASGLDKVLSVWNLPKAIKASLDLSAPFRQGILLAVGHPKEFAGAFKPMMQALRSDDFAKKLDAELRATERPGLYLAPIDNATLGLREEQFMSSFADKIPGVSATNRAYVTFLNKLRADVYDTVLDGWQAGGKLTDANRAAETQGLANVINHFTGRGDIPMVSETTAKMLNGLFFSPRFVASRFQSVGDALGVIKSPSSLAAREAASDMVKFVGAGITVLGLAKLAGLKVEDDPRAASFGKIQIGPHQVDIWGGEQQVARYTAQFITGQAKTAKGQIKPVDDSGLWGESAKSVAGRFVRSKLSPTAGEVNNVAGIVGVNKYDVAQRMKDRKANTGKPITDQVLGRDFIGDPLTIPSLPERLLAPMGWDNAIGAVAEDDNKVRGTVIGLLNLLGVGTNTFEREAPAPTLSTPAGGGTFRLTPPGKSTATAPVTPGSAPATSGFRLTPPGGAPPPAAAPSFRLTPPGGKPSGLVPNLPPGEVQSVITTTAQRAGIDHRLALAVAQIESNFNPAAVGDTDTPNSSHGVFQERLNLGRGGFSVPDPDPARQTERFAADVRALLATGFRGTPGQIAAAVQRPFDAAGYARKVDAAYGGFR